MSAEVPQLAIPETVKEWYQTVKKRIESDDETTSLVTCLAVGAAGTVAVGTVWYGIYKVFGPSSPAKPAKAKSSRSLRLLSRRSARTQASGSNSNNSGNNSGWQSPGRVDTDPDNEIAAGVSQTDRIFNQLRSAYAEDKCFVKHTGGCHCGRVRFIVEGPVELDCVDSDRNMYTLKGRFPHLVVPKSRVVLLRGDENIGVYHFGSEPVGPVQEVFEFQNLFCKTCGVHCFGYNKPKDTLHVNTMCLDMDEVERVSVAFDSDSIPVLRKAIVTRNTDETYPLPSHDYLGAHGTYFGDHDSFGNPTQLDTAAGALRQSLANYGTNTTGAAFATESEKQKVKESPLLASSKSTAAALDLELAPDGTATKLFDVGDPELEIGDVESPLTQLFSVERLRLHLKKHVQDDVELEAAGIAVPDMRE